MRCARFLTFVLLALAGRAAAEPLPGAAPPAAELQARLRKAAASAPLDRLKTRHRNPDGTPRYVNRLALSNIPFLQDHALQPVNWYPWGPEAFAAARRDGKPIFLSIGFSTCRGCRVMSEESFDDPAVAEILNRDFIPVQVDREERPDVDRVYLTALQRLAGKNAWPVNVFLTPDGGPISAASYVMPEDVGSQLGLRSLAQAAVAAWKTRREGTLESARALVDSLRQRPEVSKENLNAAVLNTGGAQLAQLFDPQNGGFGRAPKFPQVHTLPFLLRYWQRSGDDVALGMVTTTLDHISRGAITDLLGGGIHRYTTDAAWRQPHYEKMLYDQALAARVYVEAFRASGNPVFNSAAREILTYALRDLVSPEGAFYSAEEADRGAREGAYYEWTRAEVVTALGAQDGPWVADFFGLPAGGEPAPLSIPVSSEDFMKTRNIGQRVFIETMARARAGLFSLRGQRPRPPRDEKIIAGWNGLMIAALADASLSLREPKYAAAAKRAAEFVLGKMQRNGRLMRLHRGTLSDTPAFLDDYASLVLGLHQLYEATLETRWLAEAERLALDMVRLFKDPDAPGLRFAATDHEKLVASVELLEDTGLPAAQSMAAYELLRLGHLLRNGVLWDQGRALVQVNARDVEQAPSAYSYFLLAPDFIVGPGQEIVLAAPAVDDKVRDLRMTVQSVYLPRALVAFHAPGDERAEKVVPFVADKGMTDGKPTVHVCQNYKTELVTTDATKLREHLGQYTLPMRTGNVAKSAPTPQKTSVDSPGSGR